LDVAEEPLDCWGIIDTVPRGELKDASGAIHWSWFCWEHVLQLAFEFRKPELAETLIAPLEEVFSTRQLIYRYIHPCILRKSNCELFGIGNEKDDENNQRNQ
jgi:hypothetical protein